MTNSWEAYFIFSEKERKGIIVLGIILGLSILISLLAPPKNEPIHNGFSKEMPKLHLFKFNPNTIDSADAIVLGIPAKQVHTLMRYRNKGGYFYKKEDILKLYGLDPVIAHQLIPFIELTPKVNPDKWVNNAYGNKTNMHISNKINKHNFYKLSYKDDHHNPWLKMKKGALDWAIDINEADANEWQVKSNLPMSMIQRIINYKNYLGGFKHPKELIKVYGLSDSIMQFLWPHLVVRKNFKPVLNSSNMNFSQWKSLGIFDDQQIFEILKLRKQQGGKLSWKSLVILFDLPEKQAIWLKSQIVISD